MRRWTILLALLTGGPAALSATPARACECPRKPVPMQASREASLVAFGTIREVVEGQGPRGAPALLATLEATEVRKGTMDPGELAVVSTPLGGKACGLRFDEGERWLIFARHVEGEYLVADHCGLSRKTDDRALVRRLAPRAGEPYWDGLLALEAGDLNAALQGLEAALESEDRVHHPLARKALVPLRRLLELHGQAMGALEQKKYARALTLSASIEKVKVPFLPAGHWKDEGLLRSLREKARAETLAALDAEDWPRAYRHARILQDAGDEVEGRSFTGLLQHRARAFYDQGSRLLYKSDPAKQAEGRKLLKLVVEMTDPGWRYHESAKDKLSSKRKKRPGRGSSTIPKKYRR